MTVGVGLGLADCQFASAAEYWRWVDMCEDGGVDSIWQTDRLLSRQPMLECMSTMAALAGRTRRIRFGMNVVSLAMRDPILVAKQCATIDFFSDGRLLPAFGIGSPLAPEWTALNLETRTRGAKTDEALDIISRLWREDSVDYDGQHFQLTAASISPKPVQAELPMWIGGSSHAAIKRTARIGTGWLAGSETPAAVAPVVESIRTAVRAAGRSIDDDHYGAGFPFYFGQATDPLVTRTMDAFTKRTGRDPDGHFAMGNADTILARLEEYVAAGISKFVLRPLGDDAASVLAQTRKFIDEVLPQVATRWPRES